jgi:DNA-binding beta-propeller fold protein YncE
MITNTPPNNNWLNRLFARSYILNWEVVLFLVIFMLAIFTRFYDLGARVMSHDESLHTRFSYNLSEDGNFQHSPLMHGPILFHATALFYTLFGDNDFSSRIYPAILSVLLVMSPLLFRQWLGRWGTILAALMFLVSPILMYYGRYIRHDIPSIFSAILLIWAVMMYIKGPENQQRKPYWLYLIAVAMIWNLGSKETSFIYIFLVGIFLLLYFIVRLIQHFGSLPGKPLFYLGILGIFTGGVMTMGMYIILDIIQFDMLSATPETTFSALEPRLQGTFILWTALVIGSVIAMTFTTMIWAYRGKFNQIPWTELGIILAIALAICAGLVVVEELSHTDKVPDAPAFRWWAIALVWLLAFAGFAFLYITRRRDTEEGKDKYGRGFWRTLDLFPEFDLIIVIGTLILPWATALVPNVIMRPDDAQLIQVASSLPGFIHQFFVTYVPRVTTDDQIGYFVLNLLTFIPLLALSIAVGLVWNWRRWLETSIIFHILFAFFFTTIFTNMAGLATGWVYSLGYWLEQQDVRRGSQPQYYYLLVIMPFYEFLPVIGSILTMFTGMTLFWRWRKEDNSVRYELKQREQDAAASAQLDSGNEVAEIDASETLEDNPIETPSYYGDSTEDFSDYNPLKRKTSEWAETPTEVLHHIRDNAYLDGIPFLLFFSWFGVLNLVGYSLAGEKMPWLGTHLTMPLIFLSAWLFGRIIDRIDFQKFLNQGWIVSLVLLLFFVGLFQSLRPLMMGTRPFSGLAKDQLDVTYSWLVAVLLTGAALATVFYLMDRIAWQQVWRLGAAIIFGILSMITMRSALLASFVNYDYATEFLVYAHSAPGVKWVLNDIEEISLRTTDGYDLKFAYDNEVSWPYSWYFRNFKNAVFVGENPTVQNLQDAVAVVVGANNLAKVEPILEDRYIRYEHIRLWWPMQEYFYLNVDRVNHLLNPFELNSAQIRQGIFDIWWDRDYTSYGLATNKDLSITNWPVSDRMYLYVRRDVAAQIWPYGVGEGEVVNPLDQAEQNLCTANWQPTQALVNISGETTLTNPLGIAIDGTTLYAAEEFGHRVSMFSTTGDYLGSFGQEGNAFATDTLNFTRPNSVAIAPNGSLLVADTWNFRIQYLDNAHNWITAWGQSGTYGFDAPEQPVDAFWGPRDVAASADGLVFVSDTGNKRVRVYQLDGNLAVHVYDIGKGGSGLGQLDEPSGLALHPDGRLFVADTWNRRVSVFTKEGVFLETIRVRGWYQEQGNRPYLAIDPNRELLYVTDPDAGRVLVYTTAGDCVGSFGQAAGENPTLGQFGIASGIALDSDGYVYVSDTRLGRILKFPPFEYAPPASQMDSNAGQEGELIIIEPETTDELLAPELSQEAEATEALAPSE